jgi:2-isopropylmalate synthase
LHLTEDAVTFAVKEGLPVMYVTEDTTRADPDILRALYTTAIRCGATAVCVCDTVGHSTPDGARAVVRFVKTLLKKRARKTCGLIGTGIRIGDSALSIPSRQLKAARIKFMALRSGW